jgi:hypothetical protein
MKRLTLLVLIVAISAFSSQAWASKTCMLDPATGLRRCAVGIPVSTMEQVFAAQKASEWCWAATMSMIFGYYGHPVAQETIVEKTWNAVVNWPAFTGEVMTSALNKRWTDQNERTFQSTATVYDLAAGKQEISNSDIARELALEHPLVIGTQGHAMVLTAMEYLEGVAGGVQVLTAVVQDPWPGAGGVRTLRWSEMSPTYVAQVRMKEIRARGTAGESATSQPQGSSNSSEPPADAKDAVDARSALEFTRANFNTVIRESANRFVALEGPVRAGTSTIFGVTLKLLPTFEDCHLRKIGDRAYYLCVSYNGSISDADRDFANVEACIKHFLPNAVFSVGPELQFVDVPPDNRLSTQLPEGTVVTFGHETLLRYLSIIAPKPHSSH